MAEAPFTRVTDAEDHFDGFAESHGFHEKQVFGGPITKTIDGQEVELDRRLFAYNGPTHRFWAYAYSRNPTRSDTPLQLRARLLRHDMFEIEEAMQQAPRLRASELESAFGLGFKTPADVENHYLWGEIGCCGPISSRAMPEQWTRDLQGSLRRMENFDSKTYVHGEIGTFNPDSGRGTLDGPILKKLFFLAQDLPEALKRPKKGTKLRFRILNGIEQPKATSIQLG